MADVLPSKERGHLAVAAIRVIAHRQSAPPTPVEIAELLEWGGEETHVVLRGLVSVGIVHLQETPFEAHYEVADYAKLEALKLEAEKEVLEDEVADFQRRSRSKHADLEKLFEEDEAGKRKREKMEALEKEFTDFKKKPRHPTL